MAFSISPERQDEILNDGFRVGCPVRWKNQGHLIPAVFLFSKWDNTAGIMALYRTGEIVPMIVRLRNISKRVSR